MRRENDMCGLRRRRHGEDGQAMVEFALILFPLLLLVAGIIQFGIALNYWLDMQRVANQGARWAVVDCGQQASTPLSPNPCTPSLAQALRGEALTRGLGDSVCVAISYPNADPDATPPVSGDGTGSPVKVRLTYDFDLLPILGVGALRLKADATMRIEQPQDNVDAETTCL